MAKQKISYAEAVSEIESILEQIENGSLNVDELTDKVKRVTFLIKLCKTRLLDTEEEVNKILHEEDDVES